MAKRPGQSPRKGGRARNAKDVPATPPETDDVKPSETIQLISKGKLEALMRACRSGSKDVASINGTIREKIGYAKEHDHLHTGALAIVRKFDKMEPEALADLDAHLEHYKEVLGLNARIAQVQRLSFGPGKEPDDEEGDDEGAEPEGSGKGVTSDDKLRRAFPAPRSVPAE